MGDGPEGMAAGLAGEARWAIGCLNEVTGRTEDWPGLDGPGDVAAVLSALAAAAAGLQQTATQLAEYLDHELQSGRLDAGAPYYADPLAAVAAAGAALDHAQMQAGYLAGLLADAAAPTQALYTVDQPGQ